MGVIPVHLKTLMEKYYQLAEKEQDDLHEQEKTFLTVMRTIRLPFLVKTVKIIYCDVFKCCKKISDGKNADYKKFRC